MLRTWISTILTVTVSVVVGISSTLVYQRVVVRVTPAAHVLACPEAPKGLEAMDTTYKPAGRVLPSGQRGPQ